MRLFPLLLIIVAVPMYANVQLSNMTAFGSGCNNENVETYLIDDYVKVVFFGFNLETSEDRFNRMACNIALNAELLSNVQIRLKNISMNGALYLSDNASARFYLESFFAGTNGPVLEEEIFGKTISGFSIGENYDSPWSDCGDRSLIIRVNTSVVLKGNSSYVKMNTFSSGIEVGYESRACQ